MELKNVCIFAGAYYCGDRTARNRGDWWNSNDLYIFRCYHHDKKRAKKLSELCEGCPHYAPYKNYFKKKKQNSP